MVSIIGKRALRPLCAYKQQRENGGDISAKKSYEEQKQDGERKAAKRLLEKHGEYYRKLKATLRGDDLYAKHNTGKAIVDSGLSFLFTCKDESHPWITEQVKPVF
ncbi:MAG: hypothetical protein LBC51_01725 [Treponema sp.]|jgi:hypothetical protein|nr:hypothetical protein [Treponema sp.]